MDENKWEYDYSSSNNPAGDTGYPNVGSSGMNTANTASAFSESTQPSGGATPPPAGPQNTAPAAPKKPRKNAGKAIFRSNPDGLQGKATQNAVKKAVQTVCNGYGNSFQVLRSFYENQRHSNGLCPL